MRWAFSLLVGLVCVPSIAAEAVPLKDGAATLSPANTKIAFVGTHSGDAQRQRQLGGCGQRCLSGH